MPREDPHPEEQVRALLNRRSDAAEQHRTSLGRLLGLDPTEAAAILHIGRSGQLRPGDLGRRLGLTSGGVTALVQRLERAGHVRRHAHPRDRRSTLLSLEPATVERAAACYAPLVAELDALVERMPEGEQAVLLRFLERVVEITERHARLLASTAEAARAQPLAPPTPGLWA